MYRKECVMNVEKNKIKENQIPNILEQAGRFAPESTSVIKQSLIKN